MAERDRGAGWQKDVSPPVSEDRPTGLPRAGTERSARVVAAAREVVSAYEGVTMSGDWLTLGGPIVKLRAVIWRLDGVITEEQDRRDAYSE